MILSHIVLQMPSTQCLCQTRVAGSFERVTDLCSFDIPLVRQDTFQETGPRFDVISTYSPWNWYRLQQLRISGPLWQQPESIDCQD